MDESTNTISRVVEPTKVNICLAVDDWVKQGTVWHIEKEVPEIAENGITTAYPNEDMMKEKNKYLSFAAKVIDQIFSDDALEMKTENGKIIADFIDNEKPLADIYIDIEQLPFN